jgi:hypothetical protein
MESWNRIEKWVKRTGVVLGIAAVGAVALAFRVPDGSGVLGADVILAVAPTGELGVSPSGPFVTATGMRAGSEVRGEFRLHNQTGRPLLTGLRALPESRDLDSVLRVEIRSGAQPLFKGTLGKLRRGARIGVLRGGEQRRLRFRAWIPASLRAGFAGRIETVSLRLRSSVVEKADG